ncbi:MAG: FUSC family protein [Rhodococcus sp. (in: high G+C Gram-positive bacteria)]|uniref:FUSC family protein n=1 Tax=Rhodococcus sp. EPR-157 TaxID=1813677 RepID=UPI0007BB2B07|nr:FUSC family protein [Rhodococcus sp. EPR-157]KZF06942.1 fusaric acid resistance protein [Rhodococcus sp. EPR-157]
MTASLDRLEHSRSAFAHAVSPRTWRQALAIAPSDASFAPALRVGLAVTIVLVGGGFLGRPDLAGFAALGALCSAFGRYEPYPRRAGKIALVSALIIAYASFGALLGATTTSAAVQVLAISISAGVAAMVLAAFAITGPGAVILIFASTAAVAFSHTEADITTVCTTVIVGAAVGWVASMLPALVHPVGPAQLSVARALAAVDSRQQDAARAAIARARTVVALNTGTREHRLGLVTLLDDAEALLDAWANGDDPTHASDVLAHERELRKMRRYDALEVRAAQLDTPPRNFFAAGLTQLTSPALVVNAARITVAAALAAWCATLFGFEHPLWATMGAIAAMQGITFHTTVQRGIQRLLGNIGGAIFAAGLIALSLGYWQTVVAIVALQIAAELLVLKNYALTTLAITPMALLLTGLAGHLTPAVTISRIGDTLIGVLIGIVIAALTIERADRYHRS